MPAGLRIAALTGACILIIAAACYLAVVVLVRLAPLTLAVFAALLMFALVSPVSARLRRLRVPPSLAALAAVLTLITGIALPLVLIGEQTASQFPDLRSRLDQGLNRLRDFALNGPVPISERQLDSVVNGLSQAARRAAPDPVGGASTAAQVAASALIALVLLFFLLKDSGDMWRWVLSLLPERHRPRIDQAAREGREALVGYVRGTVLVALIDAVGIGLALLVIGVPLALPLALLTFIAAFIPIIGATVAGAVAVLVAFVSNGVGDALLVLAAVIAVQQIEGNLLQPLIMGRTLRLHPAVVLVVVTAGTLLGGVAGAAVAVPVTAVAYRMITVLRATHGPAPDQPAAAGRPPAASDGVSLEKTERSDVP